MLSISSSTSLCSVSRKYSAMVSAVRPDTEPASRRLVHLAVDHDHVGQHPGLFHLTVEFLTLAAPFTDSAKHTDPVVMAHHVVDHFGEEDGLAHAARPEQTGLSPALQGHQNVDDLDSRLEDFGFCDSSRQSGRLLVNRCPATSPSPGTSVDDPGRRHPAFVTGPPDPSEPSKVPPSLRRSCRAKALGSGSAQFPARARHPGVPALRSRQGAGS